MFKFDFFPPFNLSKKSRLFNNLNLPFNKINHLKLYTFIDSQSLYMQFEFFFFIMRAIKFTRQLFIYLFD